MTKEEVGMFAASVKEKYKDFSAEHIVDAILTNNSPIYYSISLIM